MTRTRTPLALRLLAVPVVVAVTLFGLWVAGALVTDDFTVAMWLTVVWMGLAALGWLAIALRFPAFRWPVLGAYAATAATVGVVLGSSLLFDDVVDEQVATAQPTAPAMESAAREGSATPPPERRNVLLREGRFAPVRHDARGTAQVIRLAEGGRVLTLTRFDVDNGPDLRVYLVAGPARDEDQVNDYVDLGALKGNQGNQQYPIPRSVDVGRYATAVIWCRAFSVNFARAPLQLQAGSTSAAR